MGRQLFLFLRELKLQLANQAQSYTLLSIT